MLEKTNDIDLINLINNIGLKRDFHLFIHIHKYILFVYIVIQL